MSRGIFGWDLPPGCSVNDIPGNRPEDEKQEAIENGFWDGKHVSDEVWNKFSEAKLDDDLMNIVTNAIDYGMGISSTKTRENILCDQAMYKSYRQDQYLDKIRGYFKRQRELLKAFMKIADAIIDEQKDGISREIWIKRETNKLIAKIENRMEG